MEKPERSDVSDGVADCRAVEDSGAAANDGLALCRESGKRSPRRGPMLFQSVAKARSGVPLIPAKVTTPGVPETGLMASGIERVHLVADDPSRELDVPAQAGIDGQAIRDAPVVLCIQRQVGCARGNLVGNLNARRVHLASRKLARAIAGCGRGARQVGDQRTDREVAGRTAVADFVVGAHAILGAELECVAAMRPGNGFQELLIHDRRLKAVNHRRISQRRAGVGNRHVAGHESGGHSVTGNREGRKGGVGDARQTDLRRQIFPIARARIEKLAAQVGVAEIIRDRVGPKMCVYDRRMALHAHIGDVRQRIGGRDAVGSGVVGVGVVDVVACRHQIRQGGTDGRAVPTTMLRLSDVAAAADEIVGVGGGARRDWAAESSSAPPAPPDRCGSPESHCSGMAGAWRPWIRSPDRRSGSDFPAVLRRSEKSPLRFSSVGTVDVGVEAGQLPRLLPGHEEMRLVLANRSADGSAILVQPYGRRGSPRRNCGH